MHARRRGARRERGRAGPPVRGPRGQLLDALLAEAGLARADVFITNVVKARPPGNRDPRADEVAHHLPWLEQQLALSRPRVIDPARPPCARALRAGPQDHRGPRRCSSRAAGGSCRGSTRGGPAQHGTAGDARRGRPGTAADPRRGGCAGRGSTAPAVRSPCTWRAVAEREPRRQRRRAGERRRHPLGHRRPVLEAVARAAAEQPDRRVLGMRRGDEVRVGRELVAAGLRAAPAAPPRAPGSASARNARASASPAAVAAGQRRVRVERRAVEVGRRLDAEPVDVARAVDRVVEVDVRRTPACRQAGPPSKKNSSWRVERIATCSPNSRPSHAPHAHTTTSASSTRPSSSRAAAPVGRGARPRTSARRARRPARASARTARCARRTPASGSCSRNASPAGSKLGNRRAPASGASRSYGIPARPASRSSRLPAVLAVGEPGQRRTRPAAPRRSRPRARARASRARRADAV